MTGKLHWNTFRHCLLTQVIFPSRRARPSYPAPAVKYIQSRVAPNGPSTELDLIELGSGTGIFSRLLLSPPDRDTTAFASAESNSQAGTKEYPDWSICSLYAVEPSEGMRQQWQNGIQKLVAQGKADPTKTSDGGEKEILTLNGGFSDLAELKQRRREKGLKYEGWADAVLAAQAWHWAHPKYEEALVSRVAGKTAGSLPYRSRNSERLRLS